MAESNRGSFGSKVGMILATAGGAVGLGNVWRFPYMAGYYAVVSGWCLQYVYASIMGELHGDPTFVANYFKEFSADPIRPVMWTVAIFLICHFVIIHGVRGGIEKASKVMMPLLFILLLIIVVSSCLLPDAGKGIEFLLKPDFGKVDRNVFLNALGQSFYSMSIGMGCICTYASYFSRQTNLLKSAIQISAIDLMVAVLAGLMIFPAAFSVGISPDSGPSLIFITLPNVFNEAFAAMPVLGWIISLMFYVLLSVAALTSLMSLHEVNTSFFYEELKIDRKKGAMIVTVSCAIIGAFCSLSLGATDKLSFYGKTLFDWFDFVTGQLFLPTAGFLTCLFLGWYVPKKVVQDEFTNWGTLKGKVFNVYLFLIKFVCPILIFLVFLNQFGVLG